jgi:hypothetical protein
MQIPTVPAFVTGDTSIAKLRQLSQCVSFVSSAQSYPVWHLYRTATFSLATANTWFTVPMTATAFDSDRIGTGGGVTIATQGYYACEACVPFQTQSSVNNAWAAFLFTAGTANPHYSSGTTIQFGLKSGRAIGSINMNETLSPSDFCPVVCFPGDTIVVQANGGLSPTVIDNNTNATAVAGRFVCQFTGRWVRIGS